MLECQCCGLRFCRPRLLRESRGQCFGFPAWEEIYACPGCGGGFVELGQGGDKNDC